MAAAARIRLGFGMNVFKNSMELIQASVNDKIELVQNTNDI